MSPPPTAGPRPLKSRGSPLATFVFTVIFTAIWNGILSVFVYHLGRDWRRGRGSVFPGLCLIPFILIGIGALVAVVVTFLKLFNPRAQLVCNPSVPLGEMADLGWITSGRTSRMTTFRITLQGREEATYRRGTDTTTDTSIFFKQVLLESQNPAEIERGRIRFSVPETTMHSFTSSNNKVVWFFAVDGEIPHWPDMHEEFTLEVLPVRMGPATAQPEGR